MKLPFARNPARTRKAAAPASYAKLLLNDRETKNAIAGIACLFVAALLIAHTANPGTPPPPEDAAPNTLLPKSSAARPAMWLPAPRLDPVSWAAIRQPALLAAHAAPGPASPFFFKGSDNDREHALDCLAGAAWYEAGNDAEGQKSVIQVVLNRVRHPSFPSTVCGVVFQGSERETGCQFTFTCDGSIQRRSPSMRAWKTARLLAEQALEGTVDDSVGQATHYHADYVAPWWSTALQRVSQIGAHIFYRWPGGQGQLVGKRNWGTEANAMASVALADLRPSPDSASDPAALALATITPAIATADPGISPAVSRTHRIAVDPRSPNGRWAVTALDRCAGETSCSVIAYGQAAEPGGDIAPDPVRMERPLFLFVRDSASGMELALWDCDRVARPQSAQCLPEDRKALAQLMRER